MPPKKEKEEAKEQAPKEESGSVKTTPSEVDPEATA